MTGELFSRPSRWERGVGHLAEEIELVGREAGAPLPEMFREGGDSSSVGDDEPGNQ